MITGTKYKDTYEGSRRVSMMSLLCESKALSANTVTRISDLGMQTQGRQKAT